MPKSQNIITNCICNECGGKEVRVIAQKSNENMVSGSVYWCHECGDYHEEKK